MEPIIYDLVVIGSGPAGESGAAAAALFGKRVAMIERSPLLAVHRPIPGRCPARPYARLHWQSQGFVHVTSMVLTCLCAARQPSPILCFMSGGSRPMSASALSGTLPDMALCSTAVLPHLSTRTPSGLHRQMIGEATRVAPGTGHANTADGTSEVLLKGERILIATGSSPVQPPGFPFKHPRVLDSDEILQLDRLPRSLAVVGAGVIGSEYACTFAALGTAVWVIDGRDELMPFLDREVSHALADAMNKKLGIEFIWKNRGHRL